jgi:hypothetical protein
MSAPRPHSVTDLALAPVLIGIERNLAALREADDLQYALALQLNDDGSYYHSAAERAARVQRCALIAVDQHGWTVAPTADLHGLAVRHGEYIVSIMLGQRLTDYVRKETASPAQGGGNGSAAGQSPSGIDS